MTWANPNCLPKASPPNTITKGVSAERLNVWGTQTQSIIHTISCSPEPCCFSQLCLWVGCFLHWKYLHLSGFLGKPTFEDAVSGVLEALPSLLPAPRWNIKPPVCAPSQQPPSLPHGTQSTGPPLHQWGRGTASDSSVCLQHWPF